MKKYNLLKKIKEITIAIEDSGIDIQDNSELCEIFNNLNLLEQLILSSNTSDIYNIDNLIEQKSIEVNNLL